MVSAIRHAEANDLSYSSIGCNLSATSVHSQPQRIEIIRHRRLRAPSHRCHCSNTWLVTAGHPLKVRWRFRVRWSLVDVTISILGRLVMQINSNASCKRRSPLGRLFGYWKPSAPTATCQSALIDADYIHLTPQSPAGDEGLRVFQAKMAFTLKTCEAFPRFHQSLWPCHLVEQWN